MDYAYGLTFKNAHSMKDHALIMQSVDRSLLPAVKRQQVDILSIDGKFDLQVNPVYDSRTITVNFTYAFKTLEEMQAKKRETAQWLSGRAKLIFDDEPSVYWDAKVFEAIAIEQTFHTLAVQVGFECSPFAYGAEVIMPIIKGNNPIDYHGNVRTPTLIILRNEGDMDVESINITAVVRVTGRGTA